MVYINLTRLGGPVEQWNANASQPLHLVPLPDCAEGRTPLHLAALGGHTEVATFLLQVGAAAAQTCWVACLLPAWPLLLALGCQL
jgi:hypothetical protein